MSGTPVADMLAHSPPIPLIIDHIHTFETITVEDQKGILLALTHREHQENQWLHHRGAPYPLFPPPLKVYSPGPSEEHTMSVAAGLLPEDVYTNTLPSWRAALRRKCVAVVERESKVISEWQVRSYLFFFLSFSSQHFFLLGYPRLLCWRRRGMGRERRWKS